MSIKAESIWAGQPTTSRGVAVHLSYDTKSDRIAYASNRSVFLRSVANPETAVQYTNHTASVSVAKFAPSGFYVASGDEHGNVKVWDCVGEDMVTKGEYQVISGRINDLSWDADSQRLIAVGDGKERYGHCFTADSGNSVGEISGHTEVVNAVAIRSVRPYRAATVGDDGNMVFYNGPPFKFQFTSRGKHTNFAHDVKFSPDGEHLATVSADKKIVLYEGKTGELKHEIDSGHTGGIFSIAWAPDSKTFVTCSADGSLKQFDVESLKEVKSWVLEKKLDNQQVGVVFAGADRIISLAYSGDLYYWSLTSDKPEKVVYGHQKSVNSIVSVDGVLYTGSADGRVCQWDGPSACPLEDTHQGQVVAMGGSDSIAYSIGWDDTIKQIKSGKFTKSTKIDGQPVSLSVSGANGAAVITENSLTIFKDNEQQNSLKLDYTATAVAISSGLVAVGDQSNNIHLYTTAGDLAASGTLPPLRAAPTAMAFDQSGKLLAVGERAGKIHLYDTESKQVVTSRWAFHTGRITGLSWHSSGKYVASSSLDTNIYVYSVDQPGKNIKQLGAHIDGVNSITWTGDKSLASVGADASVKHWAVELQ